MTCGEAVKLFENIPKIRRILQTLCDVGLDYLTLGQPAPTQLQHTFAEHEQGERQEWDAADKRQLHAPL